ncbi:MAG: hypothetical protein ACLTYW_07380 [Collinsella sp.]
MLEQNADYLSRGALKQLEDRNKRELNARERSGIMEALASARTLMRDVLLTLQDEAADVVNEDVRDTIGRLAAATNVAGATRALEAVATAERNIARNVTPQLAIEVAVDIRKALKMPLVYPLSLPMPARPVVRPADLDILEADYAIAPSSGTEIAWSRPTSRCRRTRSASRSSPCCAWR